MMGVWDTLKLFTVSAVIMGVVMFAASPVTELIVLVGHNFIRGG